MKATLLVSLLCLSGCAGVTSKSQPSGHVDSTGPVCLLPGPAPSGAVVLGRVLAQKRSYGELANVVKPLASEARKLGANAVVQYENYFRFTGKLSGVLVPFARGTAVILDKMSTDRCNELGGIEA